LSRRARDKKMNSTFVGKILSGGLALILLGGAAIAQKSKNPGAIDFQRGLAKAKKNNCAGAIEDFSRAIALNPRDARFYKERGGCLSLEKRPAEALADFDRALALEPKNAAFYFGRAMLFYEISLTRVPFDNKEKIFADLDRAIGLNPRSLKYLETRAAFYRLVDEFEKAIADHTAILRLRPRNFDALIERGWNYVSVGAYQKAIDDYTAALKLKPRSAVWVLKDRAAAYRALGRSTLAAADEEKAQKLESTADFDAPLAITVVERVVPVEEMNFTPQTEEELMSSYKQFSEVEKDGVSIEYHGFFKFDEDYKRTESERLNKAAEAAPQSAKVFFERGNFYLKINDYANAIADFSTAIKLDPNDLYSFNNRGLACAKSGNYERAIADFTRTSAIAPKRSEGPYNFVLVLLNKGLFEQAKNIATSYLAKQPDKPDLYRLRAIAYRKLGQTAEAEADRKKGKSLQ
jgi:tetratricopeptide (TPR) repeat protein